MCPKRHIDNLDVLRPSPQDHALVAEMLDTGRRALQQLHPGAPQKLGFHKVETRACMQAQLMGSHPRGDALPPRPCCPALQPPFNSVLHLHLHAMALPMLPAAPKWKYAERMPWWLPVEQALEMLQPRPAGSAAEAQRRP